MAQSPKQGIPPTPDPNVGRNIHGQPNPPPDPNRPETPPPSGQVNVQGQGPQPHMAPPVNAPRGLGDNTRAEMDAGKRNLQQYSKRDDEEHDAGRKVLQQHADKN